MAGDPQPKPPQELKAAPKGLPQMSKKRRRELPQRAVVVAQAKARDGGCVAFLRGLLQGIECAGRIEVNEVVRRGQWRDGWLVLDNTVSLCSAHHAYVTLNPDHAEELGLYARGAGRPL